MNRYVVCDSSVVIALLLDAGSDGQWAAEQLSDAQLLAPSLMLFEASNVIRRHEVAGLVSVDQAAQGHVDLLDLVVEQWPYEVLASRVRELRGSLTSYDASYVATAELADAPLITLDRRLGRAADLRCSIVVP